MSKDPAPPDSSFGRLFGLLRDFVIRYKGLVALVLGLAVLQAALQKGPILLLRGVVNTLFGTGEGNPAPEGEKVRWIFEKIEEGKAAFLEFFRLGDWAESSDPVRMIAGYVFLLVLVAPLGALALYYYRYVANLVSTKVVIDLRERLCQHILRLSVSFFQKQRTGDLISRFTNDTNSVRASFTLVLENVLLEPLLLLGNVAVAALVHPFLGLVVLATIPILMIPMRRLGKKVHKSSGKSLAALGDSTDVMSQMFQGFRTVKSFRLEEQEMDEFGRENEKFFRRTMKLVRAKALSQSLTFLIYMLGFGGLMVVLAIYREGLSIGDVTTALVPLATTYQHVKRLTRSYNLVKESQGALDRLFEILEEEPAVDNATGARRLEAIQGEIAFEDVDFSYGEGEEEQPVLQGLSLRIRAGETVALVGPSGAGKSTILDLVARFYDPGGGRITVDGVNLRELDLGSYLGRIATVDQRPFLFNRSIRKNILLGKPGATEEEMREAARIARVDEIVDRLPQGFDSVVGERGASLSGGELQRITIARAVIRDPAILLLDEATSALDTESERKVQDALDAVMVGRTSLVIAHRLSTVRQADRILVIQDGRLVEEGDHDSLMSREDGTYRRLKILQA